MKMLLKIAVVAALILIGWLGREAVGFKAKPYEDNARVKKMIF